VHCDAVLQFRFLPYGAKDTQIIQMNVSDLVIAGWAGRDQLEVERHIQELESIGVARPSSTPRFYRISADRLTMQSTVDVIGQTSTGEAEFVLFNCDNTLYIGLGSDHTDRKVEIYGITLSKQLCPKPVADEVWRFVDVEPHWDELILRCNAQVGGTDVLYQEGSVSSLRHPSSLLECYARATQQEFLPGTCIFCGTLPATNKIAWAEGFHLELEDPVLKRKLIRDYYVRALPIND
jgi:hypothetical protein